MVLSDQNLRLSVQPKVQKVALVNIEPKITNTAYMQISQHHKSQGDTVEWYSPLFHREYDKIYCSSLFTFTDKSMITSDMVSGGTGFNIRSRLPPEIESCELDYSIYPKCETSYIWFSRGCFRNCPFCVVPEKEGFIHSIVPKNLNPKGKRIAVLDNNFFGISTWREAITYLQKLGQPVDFQCGFDPRIWSEEQASALKTLRIHRQIRTAWDDPRLDITGKLKEMGDQLGKSRIMVYVLIGYWSSQEEDLMRVETIRKLGLDAWVMPYNKKDPYQRAFERWCNRHCGCEWKDYKNGKWR